jgi:hypothetical protein
MILLVIKSTLPGVGHLDNYRRQFYYSRIRNELFIDSINTISNKNYFDQRLDALITITYCLWVWSELFTDPNGTISNKKYPTKSRTILLLIGVDGIIYRPN